ncbi:DUF2878 domain-containing protein [bacterium]|nr:DUF2878 domain-containing protein [bacterium]
MIWWQLLVFVAKGNSALGCTISLTYVAFHLSTVARARWKKEILFILIFGLLGWLGDALLVFGGIQTFSNTPSVPFWLLCLWFNYMTSIHYSMAQIFSNKTLTLFIGFIFGPWTYLGCAKLGLVSFSSIVGVSLLQGALWMAWMWGYRTLVLRKVFS